MINRANLYGDLIFETIRVRDGEICHVDKHFNRLIQSSVIMKFETDSFTQDVFVREILSKLEGKKDARVRFVLYRESEGFYTPQSNTVKWDVEVFQLPSDVKICENLGIFNEYKKSCNKLSHIKSGNALIFVLAGLFAKQHHFDDCLILNEHGRIAEAISSNIFIVKGITLYTPPLSEGGINGVMRNVVIESVKEQAWSFEEMALTQNHLLDADEVFLTNAIKGIVSVKQFQSKVFSDHFTNNIKSIIHK